MKLYKNLFYDFLTGWMTFVPELLVGSQNLETSNFIFLYIYLIFYNGIWVVVPFLLLYQSWFDLKALSTSGAATPITSGVLTSARPTVVLSTSTSKKIEQQQSPRTNAGKRQNKKKN